MKALRVLCCCLLFSNILVAQHPGSDRAALVGTCRLVEFVNVDSHGTPKYPYGEHPKGNFVYDALGKRLLQLPMTPRRVKAALAYCDISCAGHGLAQRWSRFHRVRPVTRQVPSLW